MTLRLICVDVSREAVDSVCARADEAGARNVRVTHHDAPDARARVEMIAGTTTRQDVLDALQSVLAQRENWRITLLPVETAIPLPEEEEEERKAEEEKRRGAINGLTREEIMTTVREQARVGRDYIVFVVLSTVVAAFGMIEDSAAVVIGAMVIAPLLGPILAFAVGVALGDERLMLRAAGAAALGIALAVALGAAISLLAPVDLVPEDGGAGELMARADVGFDGIAIALASGAAAVMSLVAGVSGALVGVMVAVALLPPATAAGLFLGAGETGLALEALLLLAVNVVCVNLSAQVVLLTRGITPRTWFEKKKARRGSLINAAVWLALLVALAGLLWVRTPAFG